MSYEDQMYHRVREQHCREMAKLANDSEIRRRHEELALLHADRASLYLGHEGQAQELSVI